MIALALAYAGSPGGCGNSSAPASRPAARAWTLAQAGLQRAAAFARLGAFVEELGGLFRTAGDLGTTADDLRAMATTTRFVHTNERELAASIDYLDTCDTCDPGEIIEACTCCNYRDKSQQPEPELVAGIHGGNGHRAAAAPPPAPQR